MCLVRVKQFISLVMILIFGSNFSRLANWLLIIQIFLGRETDQTLAGKNWIEIYCYCFLVEEQLNTYYDVLVVCSFSVLDMKCLSYSLYFKIFQNIAGYSKRKRDCISRIEDRKTNLQKYGIKNTSNTFKDQFTADKVRVQVYHLVIVSFPFVCICHTTL